MNSTVNPVFEAGPLIEATTPFQPFRPNALTKNHTHDLAFLPCHFQKAQSTKTGFTVIFAIWVQGCSTFTVANAINLQVNGKNMNSPTHKRKQGDI